MNTFLWVAIVALTGLGYWLFNATAPNADIGKRLDAFGTSTGDKPGQATPQEIEDEELQRPFFDRTIKPFITAIANRLTKRSAVDAETQIRRELAQAGFQNKFTPAEWNAFNMLMRIGPVVLVGGFLGFLRTVGASKTNPAMIVVIAAFSGVIGFLVPRIWIQSTVKRRKFEIQRSLPDGLDLLCVAVEAGLGFDLAMARLCEKMKGALPEELRGVLKEIQMGRTKREALKAMADRMDVGDLTSFISALVQADQLGVSVAKVLRVQSQQARLRRRQRAEEMAMQAPIKMLFPMVGCIFPTIMVVLLGGAAFSFVKAFAKQPGQ